MSAPKLSLVAADAATVAVDALVIGVTQGTDGPELVTGAESVDAVFKGRLIEVLRTLGTTGKADEITKLPAEAVEADVLVVVGLGRLESKNTPTAEQVRRASGAAARALAGTRKMANTLAGVDLAAAVEGSLLGRYSYTEYKSEKGRSPVEQITMVLPADADAKDKRAKSVLKHSTLVAEAVMHARDFINTPPNDLYPGSFAERAAKLGADAGCQVEILDEKALRKGGFGGIMGVGQGSARPPRLVKLSYQGPKATKRIALVGKGITFDTGGISIKPSANMEQMTSDMSGAAAVIATVALAARLKLPIDVTAYAPMAENMPSGDAYRPGDVLRMYGGRTVEVQNTDAEGRLILADAITLACESEPDYLIETSTLTGAQVVALGTRYAGVMGSEDFRDRIAERSMLTGERAWPMPLPEELRADLDSTLADLRNITGHRWGGMLAAGLFLREFVAEGVQWAHIDIAGPSYNTTGAYGYTPKGGAGVPVRTMISVLEDIAANG